ncbi:unnamed protein product [Trichobilharzia regenti]|nr:unnamed protein product [Trichobilharzia regenti]
MFCYTYPIQSSEPLRNPIALTGDLGSEVDKLRTTNGPRSGTPRERKSFIFKIIDALTARFLNSECILSID